MKKTLFVLAVFLVAVFTGLLLNNKAPKSRETFAQKAVGAPVSGTAMGPYDGLAVPGVSSGWMASEEGPNGSAPVDTVSPSMLLAHNKTSPSCCPSSISTDSGCVCLTEENKSLFASRGGNRALA